MESRTSFYVFVCLLIIAGAALIGVRYAWQGIPLTPSAKQAQWQIEATIEFSALDGPVLARLTRPASQSTLERQQESGASSGYGLSYVNDWQAQWAIRQAEGPQRIYYRVRFKESLSPLANLTPPQETPEVTRVVWPESLRIAADQIVSRAWQQSADEFSMALEIFKAFRGDNISQDAELLLAASDADITSLSIQLLNYAGIASREIKVLELEDGRRRQPLQSYVKVWSQNNSQIFKADSGAIGLPSNTLVWSDLGLPVLEVIGGQSSRVYFSMIRSEVPFSQQADENSSGINLFEFSIQSLPIGEQALFKTILLIPIGALVVVFMRVIVGINTSGTFMPVLFALAFLETSLLTGLIGFILVVSTGLVFRSYLSRLNLLLVARISAVIIAVIGIISVFSILSYQLGLTEGLKITFFPLIILAWTVERMSILWEEEGPRDVFHQVAGSLSVAVIAYLFMNNDYVRYLTFNFIGIQLILLSLILLMGSYTGYRISELYRFRPLLKQAKQSLKAEQAEQAEQADNDRAPLA